MNKPKVKDNPLHGYCAVCNGPIRIGMQWKFTAQMNRVHVDADRCIEVLHPKVIDAFFNANPNYEWPDYRNV